MIRLADCPAPEKSRPIKLKRLGGKLDELLSSFIDVLRGKIYSVTATLFFKGYAFSR